MALQFEYSPLSDTAESQRLVWILSQCFMGSLTSNETYFNRIGQENFRVVRQSNQIAGGLALISMGQWWHQQSVPMVGIAAVGIAPEYRGSGAAFALLQQMLQELYTQGVPLSALYPATQRLYRKVGYEQGGSYCGWELPIDSIQMVERSLPMDPIDLSQIDWFKSLNEQKARLNNGNLDRAPALWQSIVQAKDDELLYAYRIGSEDPQGYIIFTQKSGKDAAIHIKDWVALTPLAGQRLWTFIADHRSQIKVVRWCGGTVNPLLLLLPEQTAKMLFCNYWMLRIVNVKAALEKRGYPSHLELELHLDIEDNLLPGNTGKFILSIANGQGSVISGGQGDLKLGIRGLASLYSGFYTPYHLKLTGYLDGTETTLSVAAQIFAGESPWMPDFF